MALAKMTLMGMQHYLQQQKDNLWKWFNVPDGIDIDTAQETILLRAGEFPLLYTDPFFMKNAIGSWCSKHRLTFARWQKALSVEYNPLDNYDGTEEYTDRVKSKTATSGESVMKVTGYDSDSLRTNSGDSSADTAEGEVETVHTMRRHGNLGVTTSAQMLQGDTDFYAQFNLYDRIADLFIQDFCIAIY